MRVLSLCRIKLLLHLSAQNALGNPAWRNMALAVWRLGIPMGTAKFRCVIGLCQISWLPLAGPVRNQRRAAIHAARGELRSHLVHGCFGFAQRGDLQE